MSKNYFGLVDSRNTKYQGVIRDFNFNGIGILIDDQLTTVLSNWKKYTINGPSVIIFSTLQVFFGQLEQSQPQGVICFQSSHKQKLLIKFQKDNNKGQSIANQVAIISHNQQITQIQRNKNNNQYTIVDHFYSKKEDDLLKNLTNIFETQIKKQHIDLNQYLKNRFVDQMEVFQLTGTKQMFFGFKNTTSLGFKLQNNLPTALGFWNLFPRNLNFGRKVSYNQTYPQKTKIQQGNFQSESKIFTWNQSQQPSIQCIKSAEEYFKKSTTFRNQFTKLDQIKKILKRVKQVEEKIKLQTSKKYGQTLLQNNYGSSHDKNEQIIPKQYTLQEVKQEIYKAAAKKHTTFKSSHISPYESSFRKQNKYTFDDSNRSRGIYREQYRVNEFKLNHQMKDPFDLSSFNEQGTQRGFTARKIKDTPPHNKYDLLKNVGQIIKKQKQSEKNLINQLIRKDPKFDGSGRKYLQRQNEEYVSPITNRYNKYELRTGTNERELKYATKTSPFMVEPANSQKKQQMRAYPQRKIRYLQAEKQNRPEIQSHRYQMYPFIRTDTKNDRQIRQNVYNYQANQSQQCQSKSHSNLAKYKQRLKDSTPSKQAGKQKANRYSYLGEKSKQQDDGIRSSEKLMNQLKLFNMQSEHKSKLQRSYTENVNSSPYKDRHKYIPAEPRQKLRTTNPSIEDNNSRNGYGKGRPNIYEPQIRKSNEYEQFNEDSSKFTKMFSFQDRSLSDKMNENNRLRQTNKKIKRTFQYVQ